MRNKNLIGTGVALITPFNEDYSIDFESLDQLLDHLVNNEIDYLVVMGTTAESATLSKEEQKHLLKYIKVKINSQLPIVLGVGGNDTNEIIKRINDFELDGVEAILSVSPYYNKPTQEGLFAHYEKIAKHSPLDLILYNVPGRTASDISVETVVNLAQKYSNIIGIKEASGDVSKVMSLIAHCPDDFMVISGDDKMTFPTMILGGVGVISVQAMAFPKLFSHMVNSCLGGSFKSAKKAHYELLKSVDSFYIEGNPAGVKQALFKLGVCSSNQLRLPLVRMGFENANKLSSLIDQTRDNKN